MKLMAAVVLACALWSAPTLAAGEASASPSYCDGTSCVPYVHPGAAEEAPCHFGFRYVFGLDSSGQTFICTAVNKWVASAPLIGVRAEGAPCDRNGAAAQSPDGLPLACVGPSWGQDFSKTMYTPVV
jgi:hypothetical protein